MQVASQLARTPTPIPYLRIAAPLAIVVMLLMTSAALTQQATAAELNQADALRNRYKDLREQLARSPLQQGLVLESFQGKYTLQGDVYALVEYPFAEASNAFANPDNWCEALILHLNIKYCRADPLEGRTVLSVAFGKKIDQELSDTHRVQFSYALRSSPEFTHVTLNAEHGPLGTKNYLMALEMVSVDVNQVFVHIRFSYTNGVVSKLATSAYLATIGKSKLGFTRIAAVDDRHRPFIGGVRGVAERNAMRYFLALDAYLSTIDVPPADRFEESARRWFASTERYAPQLHEVERDAYLVMKRAEYLRQQTMQE